ncbi:metallophosphoesterase family protein [Neorhizobium galegae]|uniref:metallophosphoesterase family protein n=1 Tax=Neorhizobium galegae TaxID=399 RepID=UPI002102D9C9|nr:metallophosphoesterase [Neorhizobium galegae]MCQ1854713.1 metallophosphoesterase [Neorhizobium galegae]
MKLNRTDSVAFFGDPHGNFRPVREMIRMDHPAYSIFLGDFDLDRPLDIELADLTSVGSSIFFIHGNHDADRECWHDFVFESGLASSNLTGRVIELDGVRLAGLGGVFHADVWHPQNAGGLPKFSTRSEYISAHSRSTWRDGLPLRHRSTIFPEDFNSLAALEADILITHEAPSTHRYGHSEIDDLAEVLGVKTIVHGHLHQDYRATLPNGIKVIGLPKAGVLVTSFSELIG